MVIIKHNKTTRQKRKLADSDDEYSLVQSSAKPENGKKTAITTCPHSRSLHILTPARIKHINEELLPWYEAEHAKRGMPWRRRFHEPLPTDPDERAQIAYQVWVSEIMCQQTQVVTVIPYYEKWMEKFPTIQDLAASDIETVNSLWKGLGYYSRAARLLSAAKKVVEDYNGQLPEDATELEKKIPGIGRYSSGAIASIAYGVKSPVLDGNVIRLLSRLLGVHADSKSKAVLDVLWAGAEAFVSGEECKFPGDVNQALIELGSTVCRPKDPKCGSCPLKSYCVAYKEFMSNEHTLLRDIEDECTLCEPHIHPQTFGVCRYPMKIEKKKAREESDLVLAIEWRDTEKRRWYLLEKRPDAGLLAGLWNFPNRCAIDPKSEKKQMEAVIPDILNESFAKRLEVDLSVVKSAQKFKESSGENDTLRAVLLRHAEPVQHTFSHIKKTYLPVYLALAGGEGPPGLKPYTPVTKEKQTKGRRVKSKKRKAEAGIIEILSDEEDEKRKESIDTEGGSGELKWVLEENLEKYIVGTCISKIWKSVKQRRDAGAWLHKTKQ